MQTINEHKKMFSVMMTLFIVGFVWTLTAGDLNPPGVPGSTMKTLEEVEPRIAVNAENTPGDADSVYKISTPGSYYLTGDLFANGEHGILIDADHVTLDLMGFRIWAAYTTAKPPANTNFCGIKIHDNGEDVEIRNGIIHSRNDGDYRGFRYGIYSRYSFDPVTYSRNVRIFNIRVFNSVLDGIQTSGIFVNIQNCHSINNGGTGISGEGGIVSDCVAADNGDYGIAAGICTVNRNKCTRNGLDGIYLGAGSTATENTVSGNTGSGINANENCVIIGNVISGNTEYGVTASYGATIQNNSINNNDSHGVDIVSHNAIHNNSISSNGGDGIHADDGCTFTQNTISQNGGHGIYARYGTVVKDNTAYANGESGIFIYGNGASVVANSSRNNQDYGIYVSGYGVVDQNATYNNNLSGVGYSNIFTGIGCAVGLNAAP